MSRFLGHFDFGFKSPDSGDYRNFYEEEEEGGKNSFFFDGFILPEKNVRFQDVSDLSDFDENEKVKESNIRKRKRISECECGIVPSMEIISNPKKFCTNMEVFYSNEILRTMVSTLNPGVKRKNEYDIYIGVNSKWMCPFLPEKGVCSKSELWLYRNYLRNKPVLFHSLFELFGKRLGCDCGRLDLCYGIVLVQVAEEFFNMYYKKDIQMPIFIKERKESKEVEKNRLNKINEIFENAEKNLDRLEGYSDDEYDEDREIDDDDDDDEEEVCDEMDTTDD